MRGMEYTRSTHGKHLIKVADKVTRILIGITIKATRNYPLLVPPKLGQWGGIALIEVVGFWGGATGVSITIS